ncbi:MAG: hypothetical protein ACD_73C00434G0002 [uncultured bacterium]|nr:MAG: hypothetical protein ACD_73C00434G0002 [uncultured bacterium]
MSKNSQKQKKILFISGLDPSGSAGLLADLEMAYWRGVKASAAVTALTAQNSQKFFTPQVVSAKVFKNTLQALKPLNQFDSIKMGMLGNEKIINLLVTELKNYKGCIILDPVTTASTGGQLLTPKGQKALAQKLLPLVTLWTPNLDEARLYLGETQYHLTPTKIAQRLYQKFKIPVYLKGGHLRGNPIDIFYDGTKELILKNKRIHKPFRGTGCRLASLMACEGGMGMEKIRSLYQLYLQEFPFSTGRKP